MLPPTNLGQANWIKVLANLRELVPTASTPKEHRRAFPHNFYYQNGKTTVTTAGVPVVGPSTDDPTYDLVELYHYMIKSKAEYVAKMARGNGMRTPRDWSVFHGINEHCTDICTGALRYLQHAVV